jgi:hypothetical protein
MNKPKPTTLLRIHGVAGEDFSMTTGAGNFIF